MTVTDPIADMLTHLHNATRAHHEMVFIPYLKLKSAIANILVEEDYIASTSVENARVGKTLTVNLKYGVHHEAAIQGLERVFKPGLHIYAKSTNLPGVRGSLGVAILSTSSGLLTDRQTAGKGVGGKVLAYIW